MKDQPKFKHNDPQTKEEKLICELAENLHECTVAFLNLNKSNCTSHEIFITLRDGILAFTGRKLQHLVELISDNKQKPLFIKESKAIFNSYLKDVSIE